MQITLKLYAMLSDYLPANAEKNISQLDLADGTCVDTVITQLNLPRKLVHLVLLNGVYIEPEQLPETLLKNGDWERSAIKQVASGRFGVTSYYLTNKHIHIELHPTQKQ